jgi:hypothetical protein
MGTIDTATRRHFKEITTVLKKSNLSFQNCGIIAVRHLSGAVRTGPEGFAWRNVAAR